MAIVSVKEIVGAAGNINDKFERTYTRVFRVITDSATDGTYAVRTATGVPNIGDTYLTSTEFDTGSFCKSVDPQQDGDNPRVWEVTVEYGPFEPGEEDPLLEAAEVTWGFSQFTRVAYADINGHALLNSAGDFFDPPPDIDDSRPTLTVTRNEAAFNAFLAIDYQDAINSDSFLGFSAGTAKVMNIGATRQEKNGFFYWRVTYEFCFRREGWTLNLLDQGRYKTGRQKIPEKNASGQDIPESHVVDPVPLDGNGNPLTNPTPSTAKFRSFTVYKQRPFSAFNF